MLVFDNVSFQYKKESLFQDLSLEVPTGRIIGLLGENGVGKTTLLKLASGLLFAQAGSIKLNGLGVNARTAKSLAQFYFLYEDVYVPDMAQDEYVKLYKAFYPNFDQAIFDQLQEQLGTEDKPLKELSLGNKKKFLIAFAVATGVPYLFLDEPTNGLDIPSKRAMRKALVGALQEHQTMIISTHQVRDLAQVFDHVMILHKGRILVDQPKASLESRYRIVDRDSLLGDEIYCEQKLDSYRVLTQEGDGQGLDLEFFFDAVITAPESFVLSPGNSAGAEEVKNG
jgi:ABC-2 type transport system ATP-binding protein